LTAKKRPRASATAVVNKIEIFIPLEGLIDFTEEEKRIKKEMVKLEKDLALIQKKLSNEDFLTKAPPQVIKKEEENYQILLEKKKKLDESIIRLQEIRIPD
jgi:valyl-tRNA synthetase